MSKRPPCIVPEGEKYCFRCRTSKPTTAFYVSRGRLSAECKECFRARETERRAARRAANVEYAREYRRKNPDLWKIRRQRDYEGWLAQARASNQKRRARVRGVLGDGITRAEWHAMKVEYGGRCAYCGRRAKLTMDHVEPISRGGSHSRENIVPCCNFCNISKHNLPLLHWLRRSWRTAA